MSSPLCGGVRLPHTEVISTTIKTKSVLVNAVQEKAVLSLDSFN